MSVSFVALDGIFPDDTVLGMGPKMGVQRALPSAANIVFAVPAISWAYRGGFSGRLT